MRDRWLLVVILAFGVVLALIADGTAADKLAAFTILGLGAIAAEFITRWGQQKAARIREGR